MSAIDRWLSRATEPLDRPSAPEPARRRPGPVAGPRPAPSVPTPRANVSYGSSSPGCSQEFSASGSNVSSLGGRSQEFDRYDLGAPDLIRAAEAAGVSLWLDGTDLMIDPEEGTSEKLIQAIRRDQFSIIAALVEGEVRDRACKMLMRFAMGEPTVRPPRVALVPPSGRDFCHLCGDPEPGGSVYACAPCRSAYALAVAYRDEVLALSPPKFPETTRERTAKTDTSRPAAGRRPLSPGSNKRLTIDEKARILTEHVFDPAPPIPPGGAVFWPSISGHDVTAAPDRCWSCAAKHSQPGFVCAGCRHAIARSGVVPVLVGEGKP